jgi:hypothetical protein
MPRVHTVINTATGETTTVPYTPEEEAARDAEEAAAAIVQQADAAVATERTTATTELGQQYQDALTRLNQIIDFVGTPTAAQVYDAVQDIALYLRKTLRYLESQR